MKGSIRRAAVAGLATLTAFTGIAAMAPGSQAAPGFAFTRIGGADRYETARLIAQSRFTTADTAVLATGDAFPDALAGNFLAGSLGAPILLTTPAALHPQTVTALTNLRVKNVVILGGIDAISAAVFTQLQNTTSTAAVGGPISVRRIGGGNRFETARLIATDSATTVGSVNALRTAIVATGTVFADALAGGPLAYAGRVPILVTEGGAATLNTNVTQALQSLNIQQVVVLGGLGAIPATVETQIQTARAPTAITTIRRGGDDRTETARLIADFAVSEFGFSRTHVNLARGDEFPDALTGGPHAGVERGPILLTVSPTVLSNSSTTGAARYLTDNQATLLTGDIFGGLAAISQAVEDQARTLAGGGAPGGSITLAGATFAQGATVSGTVSSPSSVANLSVSGCGLGNTNLPVTGGTGAFTTTIPAAQAAGACTLTFVIQRTNGTSETQIVPITITAVAVAISNAPDLISASFSGSVVTYQFDEPLAGAAPLMANFHIYDFTGNRFNPTTVAAIGDTVVAQYTTAQLTNATLATAEFNAVQDAGGLPNPECGVALRNVSFTPGQTTAPDLVNVTNFTTTAGGALTADFTFDAAVFPATLGSPPTSGGGAFQLILTDNSVFTGVTPVIVSADFRTVRLTFTGGAVTIPVSQIARGVAQADAVRSTATSIGNPLQAADVQGGTTTAPDLIGARITGINEVTFAFDQPVDVALVNAAGFHVYSNGAVETPANTAIRSATNANEVIATFPAGAVGAATGANVRPFAVTGTTGAPVQANQSDSIALQNIIFVPGRTSLPDLVRVAITTNAFNNAVVTYTFDQVIVVGTVLDLSDFALYDENGFQFTPTGPVPVIGADTTTVTFTTGGAGTQFTNSQALAARVGSVDDTSAGTAPIPPVPVPPLSFPEGCAPVTR